MEVISSLRIAKVDNDNTLIAFVIERRVAPAPYQFEHFHQSVTYAYVKSPNSIEISKNGNRENIMKANYENFKALPGPFTGNFFNQNWTLPSGNSLSQHRATPGLIQRTSTPTIGGKVK